MFFEHYPGTELNEYNLDWIIRNIRKVDKTLSEFVALNSITFGGAWNISKSYPAWCIVNDPITHNGYLSLKPVPSGASLYNEEYWLKISDYTAGLAEMSERVDAVEDGLEDVRQDMTDLSDNLHEDMDELERNVSEMIDEIKVRKIIIFGDSYFMDSPVGDVTPNFRNALSSLVSMVGGVQFELHADGGEGFGQAGDYSFLHDVQNYTSQFPADEVTDVFFIGGYNDNSHTIADIETGMSSCASVVRSKWPNAKISVGHFGWNGALSGEVTRAYLVNNSIAAYRGCEKFGMQYMTNSEYTMHDYDLILSSDGFHPTGTGIREIAKQIMKYIKTGLCDVHYGYRRIGFNGSYPNESWNTTTVYSVGARLDNEIVTIFLPDSNIYYENSIDLGYGDTNSYVQMLQMTTNTAGQKSYFLGNYDDNYNVKSVIPLNGYLQFAVGEEFCDMTGIQCVLRGGFLYMRNYKVNAAGDNFKPIDDVVRFHPIGGAFVIPTLDC